MIENHSFLSIGPLVFKHQVQKIQIQERNAVEVLETTRSSKNFLVDSGEAEHKVQIRLLFTGESEINGSINENGTSGLRSLIALFRCCPITTCNNSYIAESLREFEPDSKHTYLTKSARNIAITLNSLTLETVPDMPFAIQCTLVITKIDSGSVSLDGEIAYIGENSLDDIKYEGEDAFWLKKWINGLLDTHIIPEISNDDFSTIKATWYGVNTLDKPLENTKHIFYANPISKDDSYKSTTAIAESCTIQNRFSYTKLIGKGLPTPSHMGCSGRFLSLDLVFNNRLNYTDYIDFCAVKQVTDRIVRSPERADRITGWSLETPLSKLLSTRTYNESNGSFELQSVFVPLSIFTETGDEPDMINCKIDMAENNISVDANTDIVLDSGGTDGKQLLAYYNKTVDSELTFRTLIADKKYEQLSKLLSGDELSTSGLDSYSLFWPIEKTFIKFQNDSPFGILNIDTLRAVFVHPDFDSDRSIRSALLACKLATGKIALGQRTRITFSDKIAANWPIIKALIDGISLTDPDIARIRDNLRKKLISSFIQDTSGTYNEEIINLFSDYLTNGFLGDRTPGIKSTASFTGGILNIVSKSNWKFHPTFVKTLFKVVTERDKLPANLPFIYSTDGVYSAFYKLINKYTLDVENSIQDNDPRAISEALNLTSNKGSRSTYPDLLLPTYETLFGPDRWQEFAPTLDDLGIDSYDVDNGKEDIRAKPAVAASDIVSPAVWFYIKRTKNSASGIRSLSKKITSEVNSIGQKMSISLPFNTKEIKELTKLVESGKADNKSLAEIIVPVFKRQKLTQESKFRENLINLSQKYETQSDRIADIIDDEDRGIKIYIHNNGSDVAKNELTIPGGGAQIYTIIKEAGLLSTIEELPRSDADEQLVTPLQKEVIYHRHLNETTNQTIASIVDQIKDDQYSPERWFPAAKVYLVDRRGNDVIADDTIFTINSVISIDITQDKDDADLAVIKIADPLYKLQNDYFEFKYVTKDKNGKADDVPLRIYNSLKSADEQSSIKRYKLAQGRSIQIRLGYSSMAYNLPIVFTGRITEIVPGDQLTIVAQGWKAELINRQVNFYNNDPKNWGARDLAIQTISYANPEGIGDYFPEFDANFILSNLNPEDSQSVIEHTLTNSQDVDLENVGTRGIKDSVVNWMARAIGFSTTDRKNVGFDTRLKNIWYPDTGMYNNIFGLKTKFGLMPSFMNDSWIVPLQPAWDVLKEASRHAWNCIIQVVPYDSQATLFMGHPDQMYYYTRGTSLAKARYNKYHARVNKNINKTIDSLFDGFLKSKYYLEVPDFDFSKGSGIIKREVDALGPDASPYTDITVYLELYDVPSLRTWLSASSSLNRIELATKNSGLPGAKLQELKNDGLFDYTALYLFSKFFGISKDYLLNNWPSINTDIEQMLSRGLTTNNYLLTQIVSKLKIGTNLSQGYSLYINNAVELFDKIRKEKEASDTTEKTRFQIDPNTGKPRLGIKDTPGERNIDTNLVDKIRNNIVTLKLRIQKSDNNYQKSLIQGIITQIDSILSFLDKNYNRFNVGDISEKNYDLLVNTYLYNYLVLLKQLEKVNTRNIPLDNFSILNLLVPNTKYESSEDIVSYLPLFSAFVYYFALYCLEDNDAKKIIAVIENTVKEKIPSNMRAFRRFHFVNNTHNIVQNNIVASTKEMWNTVVIEHPAVGSAEKNVGSPEELYTSGRLNAGANWVYYPKQEITGVIGLQFNPSLTLSNKKIKVFTELNCQTEDLAAKLACTRLAEGLQKMYRGNLAILGKDVKPYDRMILADAYTNMSGPVEVGSVIHHFNTEQGWITNIAVEAVADANSGAAILQTAILETTYMAVFNSIELLSDIFTYATIIGTLGAATPLAAGEFSAKKAAVGLAKRFLDKGISGGIKETLIANKDNIVKLGKGSIDALGKFSSKNKLSLIKFLYKEFGGPALSLIQNEVITANAEYAAGLLFRSNIINGFVDNAGKMEQLPVTLSPLLFNGIPFTAGLETEDSVWAIGAFGSYYSAKSMQAGLSRFWEDLFKDF